MKAGISCTSFILCKLSRSFRKTEITNIENREIKLFCCGGCLVTKSCLTLCDPMDCSLPGSSVHGISQARILEFVAISYSRGHSQLRNQTHVSHKSIALQADSLPPSHCIQVSHTQGLGHIVERILCSWGLRADCLYPQGKVF